MVLKAAPVSPIRSFKSASVPPCWKMTLLILGRRMFRATYSISLVPSFKDSELNVLTQYLGLLWVEDLGAYLLVVVRKQA